MYIWHFFILFVLKNKIFCQQYYKVYHYGITFRLCGGFVVVDFLFIVTPIVEVCNCSMFCCTLLYVHSSIAIIWMGKRELIALLNLSSWCLVMVERLFLAVPRGCLQFVIVVFPDHTHLLFLSDKFKKLLFYCYVYITVTHSKKIKFKKLLFYCYVYITVTHSQKICH